eukprot:gnl/Dysnectes_brevis/3358_a4225_805.p1 GENE.gnl/Dysnectes_brevis/3358_a4225_805~~gnl/Dysnectes_brevis/3358_a4225_805.p1  ORF type:complete len:825 (-),score=32.00 gnl/Dysnectes_brevis/3358_a4225_805:40-2514(-)
MKNTHDKCRQDLRELIPRLIFKDNSIISSIFPSIKRIEVQSFNNTSKPMLKFSFDNIMDIAPDRQDECVFTILDFLNQTINTPYLSEEDWKTLFAKFILLLTHFHRAGIVHNDIHLANLMIHSGASSLHPILVDFEAIWVDSRTVSTILRRSDPFQYWKLHGTECVELKPKMTAQEMVWRDTVDMKFWIKTRDERVRQTCLPHLSQSQGYFYGAVTSSSFLTHTGTRSSPLKDLEGLVYAFLCVRGVQLPWCGTSRDCLSLIGAEKAKVLAMSVDRLMTWFGCEEQNRWLVETLHDMWHLPCEGDGRRHGDNVLERFYTRHEMPPVELEEFSLPSTPTPPVGSEPSNVEDSISESGPPSRGDDNPALGDNPAPISADVQPLPETPRHEHSLIQRCECQTIPISPQRRQSQREQGGCEGDSGRDLAELRSFSAVSAQPLESLSRHVLPSRAWSDKAEELAGYLVAEGLGANASDLIAFKDGHDARQRLSRRGLNTADFDAALLLKGRRCHSPPQFVSRRAHGTVFAAEAGTSSMEFVVREVGIASQEAMEVKPTLLPTLQPPTSLYGVDTLLQKEFEDADLCVVTELFCIPKSDEYIFDNVRKHILAMERRLVIAAPKLIPLMSRHAPGLINKEKMAEYGHILHPDSLCSIQSVFVFTGAKADMDKGRYYLTRFLNAGISPLLTQMFLSRRVSLLYFNEDIQTFEPTSVDEVLGVFQTLINALEQRYSLPPHSFVRMDGEVIAANRATNIENNVIAFIQLLHNWQQMLTPFCRDSKVLSTYHMCCDVSRAVHNQFYAAEELKSDEEIVSNAIKEMCKKWGEIISQ